MAGGAAGAGLPRGGNPHHTVPHPHEARGRGCGAGCMGWPLPAWSRRCASLPCCWAWGQGEVPCLCVTLRWGHAFAAAGDPRGPVSWTRRGGTGSWVCGCAHRGAASRALAQPEPPCLGEGGVLRIPEPLPARPCPPGQIGAAPPCRKLQLACLDQEPAAPRAPAALPASRPQQQPGDSLPPPPPP